MATFGGAHRLVPHDSDVGAILLQGSLCAVEVLEAQPREDLALCTFGTPEDISLSLQPNDGTYNSETCPPNLVAYPESTSLSCGYFPTKPFL